MDDNISLFFYNHNYHYNNFYYSYNNFTKASSYTRVSPVQLTISINTVSPNVSALFRLCLLRGASLFYWHRLYVLRHYPFMNVMVYFAHP